MRIRGLVKLVLSGLLATFMLSGCSLIPEQIDTTKDWSASKFYAEAKKALGEGDYEEAIKYYEILEARYPFGKYAQQAQIEIAYAYYKYDEPESALAAADRFIKLYPRHPNIDYMYYLKGLVNFNAGRDLISKYLPQDPTQRDPGAARASFDDFTILLKRYPQSKYASDARQRMIFLRNNLAEYEIHVARYYMRRDAYVAAANRAKYVVENYQRTTAVPKGLAIMAKAYRLLGLQDLADDSLRVLRLNYPDHPEIARIEAIPVAQ
ncbi:MAG: outer membrane protein assembly factor BamD [Granulosicoccaceae bacterium]|jgi:outer membrane protein assembly factor BamD